MQLVAYVTAVKHAAGFKSVTAEGQAFLITGENAAVHKSVTADEHGASRKSVTAENTQLVASP